MGNAPAWRLVFRASALLALIAGLLLFAGATRTDDYFSWTIEPPQTAAFLGATYWAAAVLFAWASAQHGWHTVRIAALPELAVAIPLLVATLLHLDKFHRDLFGYFWVAAYAVAAPVLIYLIAAARAALTYAVLGALELLGAALPSSDFREGVALPLFAAFFATVLAVGLAGSLLDRRDQVSNSRSAFSAS
jgi:hypothetical protein